MSTKLFLSDLYSAGVLDQFFARDGSFPEAVDYIGPVVLLGSGERAIVRVQQGASCASVYIWAASYCSRVPLSQVAIDLEAFSSAMRTAGLCLRAADRHELRLNIGERAADLLLRAGRRQWTPADAAALVRLTSELFPQIRMLSQDAKRA
jgi:hypothetical protein